MTQKRHTMHGRDHAPGGADPIAGIGGAVEWEDVGSGAGALVAPPLASGTLTPYPDGLIAAPGDWRLFPWRAQDDALIQVTAANPTRITLKVDGFYIVSGYVLGNLGAGHPVSVDLHFTAGGDIVHSNAVGINYNTGGQFVKQGWISGTSPVGSRYIWLQAWHNEPGNQQFSARIDIACLYQGTP